MQTAIWAVLAAAALLWPSRLSGPLDGAPLDQPSEAILVGLLFAWLVATHGSFLRQPVARALVVALLLWKAATGAVLEQDGWCLRFTAPSPIYRDGVTVPQSWDVRADWRSAVPRCSAVMTESYTVLERFPAWFFNLAPADPLRQATPADRPPNVTTAVDVAGFLQASSPGVFRLLVDEDVHVTTRVNGHPLDAADLARGVELAPGLHRVSITGELVRSHWSLSPTWNGVDVWRGAVATLAPPSAIDRWMRPWGRFVTPVLVSALLLLGVASALRRVGFTLALAWTTGASLAMVMIALSGREPLYRASGVVLLAAASVALPRRLRNTFGPSWLLGVPLLALVAAMGWPQAGVFTWYSSGDDWWMFQRFAYRVYLQGYWLEAGEPTFWFQPFYRYIAGSLHLVFGDSSVGELFWDAGCVVVGALFAFHATKVAAGARWGLIAAVVTVAVYTLGPAWYLLGRGLSEMSSMGLLYAAALFALRARHGYRPAMAAVGMLAALAFYARLNNLPAVTALAAGAFSARRPAGDLLSVPAWWRSASRPTLLGALAGVAVALWLFTLRTWYYTNALDPFFGTQAGHLSFWHGAPSMGHAARALADSVLMVVTMSDPPRAEPRAVPLVLGIGVAMLGALRVRPFSRLPLFPVALCLAGLVGAFVARGTAYPGRFSVHMIPAAVSLTVSAVSLAFRAGGRPRVPQRVPQRPGTM